MTASFNIMNVLSDDVPVFNVERVLIEDTIGVLESVEDESMLSA
jgi:hypothetical protein